MKLVLIANLRLVFLTGIFGGAMLGVRSSSSLAFYEWDNLTLIRRIEIQPKGVFWSENGELVCISTEDSYFILRYDADAVAKSLETKEGLTDDAGIEVIFKKWIFNILCFI